LELAAEKLTGKMPEPAWDSPFLLTGGPRYFGRSEVLFLSLSGPYFPARTKKRLVSRDCPSVNRTATNRMSVTIPRTNYKTLTIAAALAFGYFATLVKLSGDWWSGIATATVAVSMLAFVLRLALLFKEITQ
jgi:hypothetical protein